MKATREQIAEIIEANDDGGFLTGGAPVDEIVEEWDGEGLTPDEIGEYIAAGVFCASKAVALKEAGITPEQAGTMTDENVGVGSYAKSLGYKVANGDLTIADAVQYVRSLEVA